MTNKVAFITQPEYFRFSYENDLDSMAVVAEFPVHCGMAEEAFQPLLEFDADFNIFFRGEFIPETVLARLRGVKINLSSEPFPRLLDGRLEYTLDSLNRYLHFRSIRQKPYDYVFHYDQASLPFMTKDGLFLSGAFPFPVATSLYAPRPTDKKWDIFFIGRSTSHREKYFGHLKHCHHFLHIAHGVWGPPLIDYIHKSSICLNVHAEPEISWEPRLQMLLASGAFVISEKITPNPLIRPNHDFVEIGTPGELHEAVAYYLAHPEEMKAIANCGCRRVREMLDAKTVFANLIESINTGQCPRFSVGKEKLGLRILQKTVGQAKRGQFLLNVLSGLLFRGGGK